MGNTRRADRQKEKEASRSLYHWKRGSGNSCSEGKIDVAAKAEEVMERYLDPKVTAIGAREEEEAVLQMRKLPSGLDEEKLYNTILKLGSIRVFRYCKSFAKEYFPVLQKAVARFSADHPSSSMMINCLTIALDQDFSTPAAYSNYTETAAFLQYVDSLYTTVYQPDDFEKSDKYITPAVTEHVAKTLVSMAYEEEIYGSGNVIPFNSFFYVLGKSDLPAVIGAVERQIGFKRKSRELYSMISALKPNKDLQNTGKAYQLVYEKLSEMQKARIPFQLAEEIGLGTAIDDWWGFTIVAGSNPEQKKPKKDFENVSVKISSIREDYLEADIKGWGKGVSFKQEKGIWLGSKLGMQDFNVFQLKSELERFGKLYGIEKLCWENMEITLLNLDVKAKKKISNWLLKD